MTKEDFSYFAWWVFMNMLIFLVLVVSIVLIRQSLPYLMGVLNPTEISIQDIANGRVVPPVYGATLEGVQVIDTGHYEIFYYGAITLDSQHVLLLEQKTPIDPSVNTYTGVIKIADECECDDLVATISKKVPELRGKLMPIMLTLVEEPWWIGVGIFIGTLGILIYQGIQLWRYIRHMRYVPDVEEWSKNLK